MVAMPEDNLYMNTLLDEIPILEETKPIPVSIYQERPEADDWYNKTLTITLSNITTYSDIKWHEPGYFLIKSLTASFYFGRAAPYTFNFSVGITNGDAFISWINVSGVLGSTTNYDLTDIFKDVKIAPGTKIYVAADQLMADAGTNPSYATLTLTGFRIRPFDIYKPSDTLN